MAIATRRTCIGSKPLRFPEPMGMTALTVLSLTHTRARGWFGGDASNGMLRAYSAADEREES